MPDRAGEPSLSEVLLAMAEDAPLDRAAVRLGLSPARLRAYLEESARVLDWGAKTRGPAAAPSSRAPSAVSEKGGAEEPTKYPVLEIFSDGAARGNPGPAGAGAVVRVPGGKIVARLGKFLDVQTNNVAEYEGLLLGLEKARQLGAREVRVFADSLLIISQLRGEWKIKHPGLKPLYARARTLLAAFERTSLAHVPREQNGDADEMSNRAIDERMTG